MSQPHSNNLVEITYRIGRYLSRKYRSARSQPEPLTWDDTQHAAGNEIDPAIRLKLHLRQLEYERIERNTPDWMEEEHRRLKEGGEH